jgi:2-polyprenyl-6-methoxyphenol hydroxylase-like FAD-dependent oxidoreductase
VERARDLRSSGNPVDVRGSALPVADAMGLLPALREAATQVTAMSLLNTAGRQVARVRLPAARGEVEIPRGDLAAILYAAARDHAEFRFDDTVVELRQDGHGVDVAFDRAAPRRFDLVIGADGLHSAVRRLTFGPERDIVRRTGLHVATMPLHDPVENQRDVVIYTAPGRLVAIHPTRGRALAAFIFRFRDRTSPDLDHRDLRQYRRLVTEAYRGDGWRVPELLDRLRDAEDPYVDAVSRVRLPAWSNGRVALLGDAASCASLLGDGSSLAIAGAHTLATALGANPTDHTAAFRRYESAHRSLVDPRQRAFGLSATLLIPNSRLGLAARNLAARNLAARAWPGRR